MRDEGRVREEDVRVLEGMVHERERERIRAEERQQLRIQFCTLNPSYVTRHTEERQ